MWNLQMEAASMQMIKYDALDSLRNNHRCQVSSWWSRSHLRFHNWRQSFISLLSYKNGTARFVLFFVIFWSTYIFWHSGQDKAGSPVDSLQPFPSKQQPYIPYLIALTVAPTKPAVRAVIDLPGLFFDQLNPHFYRHFL